MTALNHVEAARRLNAALADRLARQTQALELQVSQWLAETNRLPLADQLAAVADRLTAQHQSPRRGAGLQ